MFGYIFKGRHTFNPNQQTFVKQNFDFAKSGLFLIGFDVKFLPKDILYNKDYMQTSQFLEFLATSISMPSITIETVKYHTTQYYDIKVPGRQHQSSDVLSIKFFETHNGFINKFITNWFYALRPGEFNGLDRNKIKNTKLKGHILVTVVDKLLTTSIFSCIFAGCFPITLPSEQFSSDISNRNIIYIDTQFSFDTMIINKDVDAVANDFVRLAKDKIKAEYNWI